MEQKPQRLVVHVHDQKKIFHVSMHNADRDLAYCGWKVVAGKAKYAYEHITSGQRHDSERSLAAGLVMAMVNTNYEGWYTHFEEVVQPNIARSVERKDQLIAEWQGKGYHNVGIRNVTAKSDPTNGLGGGVSWNKRFNPSNMTLKKVHTKIDWINVSLQLDIPMKVRSAASTAIIGEKGTVDNMATLLRFIRVQMGLESQVAA